jgi:hypothetical protein
MEDDPMALKNFRVVTAKHSEEGVAVEFWDGEERRIAVVQRTALDDTFDQRLGYGRGDRRLSVPQWNRLVEENLPAFQRIVTATYEREASAKRPVERVEVILSDIQGSGEKFTGEALLDAGLASRSTGTQRPSA